MFRWPVELTSLSLGSAGAPRKAMLEVTPRGALFTLAALAHVGHPSHLAVLDAYLKGQVRVTPTLGIGEDSRTVLASLAAPLLAAFELGTEHLTLADLILLPRPLTRDTDEPAPPALWDVRGPDSVRFLLPRVPGQYSAWVRAAERFEPAGCLGTQKPGQVSPWHDAIVQAGQRPPADPVTVEVREPTSWANLFPLLELALSRLALARFGRASRLLREVGEETARLAGRRSCANMPLPPIAPADIRAEIAVFGTGSGDIATLHDPGDLGAALADAIATRTPTELAATWQGRPVHVCLAPDPDGYQTLCLLPLRTDPLAPVDAPAAFGAMRELAWETIELLMGKPLAERRTEPIALRLVGQDGRSTTLDVGASIVIVRNQTVFTGWVGSDGRVMLKLFPPGGMTGRATSPPGPLSGAERG